MRADRLRVITFLLVCIVLLAGCTGGETPTADAVSPTQTEQASDMTATPTPRPTTAQAATATATPRSTPTATSTATSTPSTRAVLSTHGAALEKRGGYIAVMSVESTGDEEFGDLNGTLRADLTNDAYRWNLTTETNQGTVTFESYRPPNSTTIHICFILEGACRQRSTVTADDATVPDANPESAIASDESPNLTDRGIVDTERGPRRLFVADGVETLRPEARSGDWGSYESFRIELYVDPETGIIRRYVIEATIAINDGETVDSRTVFEITSVGDVSVSPPDWYES